MRVALLTQHFPPHFEGGTEVVVRAQARGLAALGNEVRVVSGTDRPHAGPDVERSEVDGVPVAHLPRHPDEGYDLDLARPRLAPLLEAELAGADLVHVHHWSTLRRSAVRDLASRGVPVVVTLHDLFTTCPRFFRLPPAPAVTCPPRGEVEPCVRCIRPDAGGVPDELLARGLAERSAAFGAELAAAELVVAPSRAHAERAAALTGLAPDRIRVVPHGLCRPAGTGPARRWVPGEPPIPVLHFGHRTEAKGTLDLVRALASTPAGAFRLHLLGAEVEPGFDDRLREAAGALPIDIGGAYDLRQLEDAAAGAALAAFPSRAPESYGLVVDEALACGLPVWVSDRGALPERVGRAGRVLPAEDPGAWADAFRHVLDHPGLLEEQRGAIPARLRTSADAARELDALYRSLCRATP